ncbi:MAG: dihydrofolate reductase, partial [Olleya sp.]
GEIYKLAMPYASKIELTRVHSNFDADTFFPEIDRTQWKETANTFHKKDENHEFEFSFLTFQRV